MSFPEYSFSDEIAAPSDLGIRRQGSFDAIADSLTGMNYYMDTMAFGAPTGIAQIRGGRFANTQRPLGLRFFTKTGMQCSNGAAMHEYISTIPKGDSLGKPIQKTLETMKLPAMKGLVPGILEDVKDSLNPQTLFSALESSSYPACKKVRLPVGDSQNRIRSQYDPEKLWIEGNVQWQNGIPTQERWVLDRWVTKEEWQGTEKTEGPKVPPKRMSGNVETKGVSECFQNPTTLPIDKSQLIACILLGGLLVGTGVYYRIKQ
jgi:hypothetical protein